MPSCRSSCQECRIKVGVLSQALGSVYMHGSLASVTVGVFGPKQIPSGDIRRNAKINVILKSDGLAAVENEQGGLQSSTKTISDTCRMLEEAVQESLQSVLVQEHLGILQYDVVVFCHSKIDAIFGIDMILTACGMAFVNAGIQVMDILSCTTLLVQGHCGENPALDGMVGTMIVVSTTSSKEIVSLKVKGDAWKSVPVLKSNKEHQSELQCRSASHCYTIASLQEAIQACLSENSQKRQILIDSLERDS